MAIKRRSKVESTIPSSSMADIAFLLLIFFMVSTVFNVEKGLPVQLPRAEESKKVPKKGISHVWIDRRGRVVIDDMWFDMNNVRHAMERKMAIDPAIVTSLMVDKDCAYINVANLMEELKWARALRVNFSTRPEQK